MPSNHRYNHRHGPHLQRVVLSGSRLGPALQKSLGDKLPVVKPRSKFVLIPLVTSRLPFTSLLTQKNFEIGR